MKKFIFSLVCSFSDKYYLKGLPRLLYYSRGLTRQRNNVYSIPDGLRLKLDIDNYFQNNIRFGYYEYSIRTLIKEHIKKGDVVLDIGGNIGLMSVLAATITGIEGKVFCFEPNTEVLSLLETNIKLNNLNNVEVIKVAVGAEEGYADFHCGVEHSLSTMISNSVLLEVKNIIKVPVITIDSFLAKNKIQSDSIAFVKVDVEGFEYNVLKGMQSVLKSGKTKFLIESNPPAQKPLGIDLGIILAEFFFPNNYRVYWVESKTNRSFFYKKGILLSEITNTNILDYINKSGDFLAIPF